MSDLAIEKYTVDFMLIRKRIRSDDIEAVAAKVREHEHAGFSLDTLVLDMPPPCGEGAEQRIRVTMVKSLATNPGGDDAE